MPIVVFLAWALAGCGTDPESARSGDAGASTAPHPPNAGGPVIDPGIRAGDTLGGMHVVSASLNAVSGQPGVQVGEVRFRGRLQLSGARRSHPSDPALNAVCFFPDSVSALRLPRLASDQRFAWFCFRNREAAESLALDPASPQRITIDDYAYHFSFSDVFNTARLVSIDAGGR